MKMVLGMQKSCCSENVPIGGKKVEGLEVKCGSLYMIQLCGSKLMNIPVFVRVYRNCFEHYAIINRDQKYTNSAVYISLKHCKVYRSDSDNDNEFKLVPEDIEGTNWTFQASRKQDVNGWISALQPSISSGSPPKGSLSPSVRRSLLMPTLQESIEEEECESDDEEVES